MTTTDSSTTESNTEPPEQQITRLQLVKGMRVSIVEGMLALALAALTTGSVMTGLALALGATSIQIGIISGIPPLANFIQIIAPIWLERLKSRKFYVSLTAGTHRVLLCLSVFTIFLPAEIRVTSFLTILTLSFICASMSAVAWGTWMADLVPENIRGRYFARRNAIVNLTFILIAPFAGKILDIFPDTKGFIILYTVGLICAISNSASFLWQYEPPHNPEKRTLHQLWRSYLVAFRNRQFFSIVAFFTFWTFARTIADPFYSVFMIQHLKIPYFQIKIFETAFFIILIISSPFWGYTADKFGNRTVARFCSTLFTLTPILWIFNTPQNYILVPAIFILAGCFSAGMNLASFNLFLGSAPRKNKSVYLSLWAGVTGIVGFIGPIIGGWFIKKTESFQWIIGDFHIGSLQMLFGLSAILTLVCSLMFPEIKEYKKSISWKGIQRFRLLNPFILFGVIYNLVIYNRTREERIRLRAGRAFGKLRSSLVVEELIDMLNDPSPVVREQAALSLGEIRDTQAVDVLISKLQSPEENIQPEAARALGLIGNPKAVEPLLNHLDDSDPAVRSSVIEALGNIKDERAREALFDRLQSITDPKLFPPLVDALAKMYDDRIIKIALQRLDQFSSAVVRRQILDSIAYLLEDDDEFYEVTGLDPYEQDSWVSKRLSRMYRRLNSRKSPYPEDQLEQAQKVLQTIQEQFSREKYDPAVGGINELCNQIQGIIPSSGKDNQELELINQNLTAIITLIQLNNSINLERDEVLFMIVALDSIIEELLD